MKYIIIGLGNFGASLGEKLTQAGNEVIGVDINMTKVNAFKEKISHTICMDASDSYTVSGLPLKDTDVVIVAIGEDQGANIMATAVLKKLNTKRLISRAITPLHETVLQAIGVDEIVHPEEETAERWANKLHLTNAFDSFVLNENYCLIEVRTPKIYIGKTIGEINFIKNHNILVLSTLSISKKQDTNGLVQKVTKVNGIADANIRLKEEDYLLVYGQNDDIKDFLKLE